MNCATEVEGFDYHFIGSCFPLRAGNRLFFLFTEHQFDLDNGEQIFVIYPEDTTKAIAIHNNGVIRFPTLDLAAFEIQDEELKKYCMCWMFLLQINQMKILLLNMQF